MNARSKQSDVHDLASVMFGIGVDAGRELLKQVDADRRNIAATKQLESKTEGRTYDQRGGRDE